jgi:hypothetical protein
VQEVEEIGAKAGLKGKDHARGLLRSAKIPAIIGLCAQTMCWLAREKARN